MGTNYLVFFNASDVSNDYVNKTAFLKKKKKKKIKVKKKRTMPTKAKAKQTKKPSKRVKKTKSKSKSKFKFDIGVLAYYVRVIRQYKDGDYEIQWLYNKKNGQHDYSRVSKKDIHDYMIEELEDYLRAHPKKTQQPPMKDEELREIQREIDTKKRTQLCQAGIDTYDDNSEFPVHRGSAVLCEECGTWFGADCLFNSKKSLIKVVPTKDINFTKVKTFVTKTESKSSESKSEFKSESKSEVKDASGKEVKYNDYEDAETDEEEESEESEEESEEKSEEKKENQAIDISTTKGWLSFIRDAKNIDEIQKGILFARKNIPKFDDMLNKMDLVPGEEGPFVWKSIQLFLEDKEWLNDEGVNVLIYAVKPPSILFLNSYHPNKIKTANYDSALKQLNRKYTSMTQSGVEQLNGFWMPINIHGNHWIAIFVIIQNNIGYKWFFEPRGTTAKDTNAELNRLHITDFLKTFFNSKGIKIVEEWNQVELETLHQQRDNYSCGIYTIAFFQWLTEFPIENWQNVLQTHKFRFGVTKKQPACSAEMRLKVLQRYLRQYL